MRTLVRFAIVVAAAVLPGCGACGDDEADSDAASLDGADIDTPDIDAPPDTVTEPPPPPPIQGSITIVEAQVLGPSPAPVNTIVAEGIQLGVTFTDPSIAVAPVLDTNPGTLFGCKVTELTAAQVPGAAGINEGTVQFTVNNMGAPANPVYPTCTFVAGGTGYICPDATSSQALTATNSVTLAQINAQTSSLTVNGGTATFVAEDVGRYVKFSGTGTGFDASHIALPIVSVMSSTVVILGAPVPAPTIPLTTGMMTTLAGVGPQPGLVDPGQLSDAASATAVLTPGGGNHFPSTTITYANVGDDFTMDDTNAGLMRNIPRDGSAFTVTCNTCGTAIGTILSITTTDAVLTGQSSTAMPAPLTKRVNIRCAEVGATSITVPANVSAYIMTSGATRIQTTFIRGTFGAPSPANGGLSAVISGHAMVGFTTP